jgi:hypothetical protein
VGPGPFRQIPPSLFQAGLAAPDRLAGPIELDRGLLDLGGAKLECLLPLAQGGLGGFEGLLACLGGKLASGQILLAPGKRGGLLRHFVGFRHETRALLDLFRRRLTEAADL